MKVILFSSLTVLFVIAIAQSLHAEAQKNHRAESLAYFDKATAVFMHPRCLNCHPAGDKPTQGADMHIHIMNVQRGIDDHGAVGAKCATCHGENNNKNSGVPGAPKWALAPKALAWQGLSKGDLCRRLKDSAHPGMMADNMTKEQFIKHNGEDKLVAWGWNPGSRREPVPMTQKQFGEIIAKWINSGAECPD